MNESTTRVDWKTVIRRIKAGKCTPIISYRVSRRHFADNEAVVRAWAEAVDYPLADDYNLTRVAQYASHVGSDALSAKEEYLDFLKQRLLDGARGGQAPDQGEFLDTLQAELPDLCFSDVALRLGYPQYENALDDPLRLLAELPLPIYLTTSFATSMESALRAAGKEPRSDMCCWHREMEGEAHSFFEADPDYQPSVEQPLVFHLHGLDAFPASLVLSEDDYLDFLVKVSRDPEAIPRRVTLALSESSLLLLGYRLQDWDFRVLFRGLITPRRTGRRLLSLSIQLLPEPAGEAGLEDARQFLKRYFDRANFEIYWGDAQSFMQQLWQEWEA